jgi:2-polyprenyl-3-methyl-5-hydroxy-6-metoxy-1,4-benzoquinol methylase
MQPGLRRAFLWSTLMGAAMTCADAAAQRLAEREATMFSAGNSYERFMGRWSRLLAPQLVAFTGVKDGDRVLDVGTGTGALAGALEKSGASVQVVGIARKASSATRQKAFRPRGRLSRSATPRR